MRRLKTLYTWFDSRLQLGESIKEMALHPVPNKTASWWYVFGSAAFVLLMLQIVTGILLGYVNQRKQYPCNNLKHKQHEGSTSKHVPPTGCLIGDRVESHLFDGLAELQSAIEPGVESLQPAHGDPPFAFSI